MLTNDQMKPNRWYRLALARRKYRDICEWITRGGRVCVATPLRATFYKSADYFVLRGRSVYVKRGKNLDCIDYCSIQFHS